MERALQSILEGAFIDAEKTCNFNGQSAAVSLPIILKNVMLDVERTDLYPQSAGYTCPNDLRYGSS